MHRTPKWLASSSTEFLTAWAILGTWTCTCVWPTPDYARWPQACCPVNRALAERKPYLGGWARSSFEQGALCALAAMSSPASRYCAIPGDACFQCHGVGPCVTDPAQATLPLFIHYYGNKDAIHELDQIQAMPYLPIFVWAWGHPPHSGVRGNGEQLLTFRSLVASALPLTGSSRTWAATIAPFEMLSAEQLRMAAASDHGALQAAQALSRKQHSAVLTFATARPVLVQSLCEAITQNGKRHKETLLVSSIVQRFFSELPLRLLVILLGRLLPLLRSTATPALCSFKHSGNLQEERRGEHASCTLWQVSTLVSTLCGALRYLLRSVVCATFKSLSTRRSHPWLIFTLCRSRPRRVGLMVTHGFHPGPSFSLRSPSLLLMTRRPRTECALQHRARRTSKPSADGVASPLLLSPLNFLPGRGR